MLSQRIGRSIKPKDTVSKSYVNTAKMKAEDVNNLDKSPPKISATRKNVKIITQGAMEKYGSKAFGLSDVGVSQSVEINA